MKHQNKKKIMKMVRIFMILIKFQLISRVLRFGE